MMKKGPRVVGNCAMIYKQFCNHADAATFDTSDTNRVRERDLQKG